jgi:hypothetical protein
MTPPFIPGRELSRRFFAACVQPILAANWPALHYAAAHIGTGSDVLGFDTELSCDHDWGPSVVLFLTEDAIGLKEIIRAGLARQLPRTFLGYPVGFIDSPEEPGTAVAAPEGYAGPLEHHVFLTSVADFAERQLAWRPDQPLEAADWLSIPSQQLRSIVAGAIHRDDTSELTSLIERLRWYPADLWRFLLACGWQRIGQEDHLMSRAGHAGDELGSAIIGARLARDIMALAFLYEQRYAPYPKWYGTAFRQLACAAQLIPHLEAILAARTWQTREAALGQALLVLATMHNQAGLTAPQDVALRPFFSRPFQVIWADRFVWPLIESISDPAIQKLAELPLIGNIDQWSDNTDLRADTVWRAWVREAWKQ